MNAVKTESVSFSRSFFNVFPWVRHDEFIAAPGEFKPPLPHSAPAALIVFLLSGGAGPWRLATQTVVPRPQGQPRLGASLKCRISGPGPGHQTTIRILTNPRTFFFFFFNLSRVEPQCYISFRCTECSISFRCTQRDWTLQALCPAHH